MTFSVEVLRKKAAKCQRAKVKKYKITLEKAFGLEELLHDVCLVLFPKPFDYDARRDLIRIFNEIALEIYDCSADVPVVVEFGSFSMDLFQAKSDLDLSVNFRDIDISRDKKIHALRMFEKKLSLLQCSGHVYGVNPIITANVPVLKVVDSGTGVECDISVGNKDGILKSKILYFISLIDERFRKLCFLMKAWAKAHNINSAKDRTLNSLSIILLVAFHLQTRNPPILPPFSAILRDGCDAGAVEKSIRKFVNYGQNNKEVVAELFFTLLLELSSVERLWSQGLCVSTYDGSWIVKTWGRKSGRIRVEDFTDRTQNVARAVGVGEMKGIYQCINLSIEHISDFLSCRMEGHTLRELLFGEDGAASVCGVTKNCNANVAKSKPPPECTIRIEDTDTSGRNATQQPGEHMDHPTQPSTENGNANVAKTQMPPGFTTKMEDKHTSGQKATRQPVEHPVRSTQPSTKNCNAKVAKPKVPPGCKPRMKDKDTLGQKATQQPDEHRDQSAQPSPYETTLGKRKRADRSSLPSTRFFGKPSRYGKMASQQSIPCDMERWEPVENHGVLPPDGPGRNQCSWDRADNTFPAHRMTTMHACAIEKMRYHETDRTPYLPASIAHPIYASNIGNSMSSSYARESDMAKPLAPQMVYPKYPYNQHRFSVPNFSTASVYPTFPPVGNQMTPSHASETFRVGNLPSTSNMPVYPPDGSDLRYSANSSYPQVNFSTHEPAWFR